MKASDPRHAKVGAFFEEDNMKPYVPLKRIPKEDRPYVDPNKDRVTMTLAVPMYNELAKGHLRATMDNALAVGFDNIVVLDDGSTDDSWDVLTKYANTYDNIKIYRSEKNSVIHSTVNRWKTVIEKAGETEPDWLVVRAADQIYSYKATIEGGDHFRKLLTQFYHQHFEVVRLPCIHLWRSMYWYRADDTWGADAITHSKTPIWRYHPNFHFKGRERAGSHLGWHHPTSWGFGDRRRKLIKEINPPETKGQWPITVLHLGHVTHESKRLKFIWNMAAAEKNHGTGRNIMMPPANIMPPVTQWLRFNGYKGFWEFGMNLQKAHPIWYKEVPDYGTPPIPESLYDTIKEYNPARAEEYKKIYQQCYGGK